MPYKIEKQKYPFTFTWHIENFTVCPKKLGEPLLSPSFIVKNLGETDWRLILYPRGSTKPGYTSCYLQRLSGASRLKNVFVNFRITILSSDFQNGNFTNFGKNVAFRNLEFCGFAKFIKRAHLDSFMLSPFQRKLTIRCDLSPSDDYGRMTPFSEKLNMQILSLDMVNLYEGMNLHDIVLLCDGCEFKAHQVIIYARVPKFARELKLELKSRKVIRRNVDFLTNKALQFLLHYLYTGSLDFLECDISSELYLFSITYNLSDLQKKLKTYPTQCTGRTCMNVELQTIFLPVKVETSFPKGKQILSQIIPLENEIENLIIRCNFINGSLGIERIDLSFSFSNFNPEQSVSILCKINVIHDDGTLLDFFDGCKLFDFHKEWRIPFFTQKWDNDRHSAISTDSVFTFFCDLTICYGERTSYIESTYIDSEKTFPTIIDYSALSWDFSKLMSNILFSDVSVVSEDITFPAHRAVLAARSPVFRKMFEHNMIESRKGIILIKDFRADIIKVLLMYMYSGKIDILDSDIKSLYALADKYDIFGLRENCKSILKDTINVENSCELLITAYLHCDEDLMNYTRKYIRFHILKVIRTLGWKELKRNFYNLASETLPGYV